MTVLLNILSKESQRVILSLQISPLRILIFKINRQSSIILHFAFNKTIVNRDVN